MPSQPTASQVRLNNITACLMMTINALQLLATNFDTPFLQAILNTTRSLLDHIQAVKQNKDSCMQLMEQTYTLINAIIVVHGSATIGVLPPTILENIGKFTETLHKIHTFVEAQRTGNKIKKFLRQGELSMLFRDCQSGLKQGLDFFQIGGANIMAGLSKMRQEAEQRNQEVLRMIGELSDTTSSDGLSMTSRLIQDPTTVISSSTSISMLPSEPKIFHGRDSELSDILQLFNQGTPRIAILGSGGMGKTSLARAVIHHAQIKTRYQQHFELAALIGANIGLKPGKDLRQAVFQHFSSSPSSLLVLDNLETLWESMECRTDIEEFLSLLTDIEHLALMITMRGAERPGKMQWTRPFLQPLKPLDQDAARKTFIDIADENHNLNEVDKVLSLTDNMPLAVSLIAHLVDSEGCSNVLARWEREKISMISVGTDKEANLEISISLSLSSPRLNRHSRDLLSLLSMLPDGLSDVELVQSKLPIRNVLGCKAALIGTALAYSNEQKCLKALVPIREYMNKIQPPSENLIRPLLKHFQFLLKFFEDHWGSEKVQLMSQGIRPLIHQVHKILLHSEDHHLKTYVIIEIFRSRDKTRISDPDTLVTKGLNHFEYFDDPDLKYYYQGSASDLVKAIEFYQAAISLAHSTGNTKRHTDALCSLALMNQQIGDYSTSQLQAFEAQRLARISANLLAEARALNIQARISRKCLQIKVDTIMELGVHMGYPKDSVLRNLDAARNIFETPERIMELATCDIILGHFHLHKGEFHEAKMIFEQCIKLWTGKNTEIMFYCLEPLGNSLKSTNRLGMHQALQFLGDIFLSYNDEDTAVSLFTVALEGFTAMDVHRSRAECMLRLGDIHKRCNDLLKAVGHWETARPLFERSSQAKQIVQIDERLASVGEDVHQQHRENLVKLAELKISSGHPLLLPTALNVLIQLWRKYDCTNILATTVVRIMHINPTTLNTYDNALLLVNGVYKPTQIAPHRGLSSNLAVLVHENSITAALPSAYYRTLVVGNNNSLGKRTTVSLCERSLGLTKWTNPERRPLLAGSHWIDSIMPKITLDWIWSEYTKSPDPAAGMQSLQQACSALIKHVLLPSHIVLSNGGFSLLPGEAEVLLLVVPLLGRGLNLAMTAAGLSGIHNFCQTELQVLTCTTGQNIATQNQVVLNWIHLVDKVYIAMVDLESLCSGHPIHILGRKRPSGMRRILAALPSVLLAKIPSDFLRLHSISVSPPAARTQDGSRQITAAYEHRSHMPAHGSHLCERSEVTQPAAVVVLERSPLRPPACVPSATEQSQAPGHALTPAAPVTSAQAAHPIASAASTQDTRTSGRAPTPAIPAAVKDPPTRAGISASPARPTRDLVSDATVKGTGDTPATAAVKDPPARALVPALPARTIGDLVSDTTVKESGHVPATAVLATVKDPPDISSRNDEPGGPSRDPLEQAKYTACFPNNSSLTASSLPGTRGDAIGHSDHKTLVFRAALKTSPGDPISAVKDPPLGSPCELLLASTGAPTAAEDEGRGTDKNQRERRSTNECAPEYKQLKSRPSNRTGSLAETESSDTRLRGPPFRARSRSCTVSAHAIFSPLLSTAAAAPTSSGLPYVGVSVTVGGESSASKIQPQKLTFDLLRISVEPKVEFGGRMERPTGIDPIGCVQYNVLPPSPAPVLAVGVRTVELGGRADIPALIQQDITAAAETHTLHALDDPSSCGIPDLACTTSASVLPLSTSVLSSGTAYLDFARVCAIDRTRWISYLVGSFREEVSPSLLWAREGIGTRAWNKLHRRGRATTH
ncbi:hypothetical protein B0H14DRAFT_3164791, partial [Mycena olivaceomarginata]